MTVGSHGSSRQTDDVFANWGRRVFQYPPFHIDLDLVACGVVGGGWMPVEPVLVDLCDTDLLL